MSDRLNIAKDAWKEVPDWVLAMIEACDMPGSSNRKVANKIGRSPGVISEVLRNRYKGDMSDFEERVRAVYCSEDITCPALGEISSADCLHWRDEASELKAGPMMVRMYRACLACPRHTKPDDEAED